MRRLIGGSRWLEEGCVVELTLVLPLFELLRWAHSLRHARESRDGSRKGAIFKRLCMSFVIDQSAASGFAIALPNGVSAAAATAAVAASDLAARDVLARGCDLDEEAFCCDEADLSASAEAAAAAARASAASGAVLCSLRLLNSIVEVSG